MSEVFFCNVCDQSVPLVEIEDGAAARVEGRVVCRQCLALLAQASGAATRRGGGWVALVLGVLALAAAGLAWYDQEGKRDAVAAELRAELGEVRVQLRAAAAQQQERGARESEERALIGNQVAALRDEVAQARMQGEQRAAALALSLEALAPVGGQLDQLRGRLDDVEATLSVVEDRQRAMRSAQDSLRDQVGALSEQLSAQRSAQAQEEAGAAASFPPEVAALLRDLQHEDGRVRYDALEKLEKLRDPRLLPHVYPLLADPYEFVRFLAASLLGDWGARAATPHLIETLLDEKNFVRAAAASSLRRITGQTIPFDKDAPEDERRKSYEAWKLWWQENGEAFLKAEP
ncbi:MAG: HEAT repeat domain-containing protein [Planctomycetota bacterium]|nr:MAG: HEAT repeat domain-containing protein [Planctomycetota bacterium]